MSARRPVSGLVGSWTRSQVPLLPLGLSGSSEDKSAGIHLKPDWKATLTRPFEKKWKQTSIAPRTSLARRPGFSIIARESRTLLGPCIIIVTPVPSRDTQGRVYHQRLPPDSLLRFTSDRLENDSSVVLLSCQFREEEKKRRVMLLFPWNLRSLFSWTAVWPTLRHSAGQSIFD